MTTGRPTIQELVQQGWGQHDEDPEGVLARVRAVAHEATEAGEVLQLGMLGTHVAGEHLGAWASGRELVEALRARVPADSDADKALWRMAATMELGAGGDWESLLARGIQGREASCRIRVLGTAAQALTSLGDAARAAPLLEACETLAAYGPAGDDPAARVLAMTGNNVACALEARKDRTPAEDALLERAAHMGRRYWEVAGDWRNVKIAEYRLAMTYLALGRNDEAERHAQAALDLCRQEEGGPSDAFFCHEALAKTAWARRDAAAAQAARDEAAACLGQVEDEGTRAWFGEELAKLDDLLT